MCGGCGKRDRERERERERERQRERERERERDEMRKADPIVIPSSPWISNSMSQPVASIAASKATTSGDSAWVGAPHARFRLHPTALVRVCPRKAPSGLAFSVVAYFMVVIVREWTARTL
jgi:hypothetical protein